MSVKENTEGWRLKRRNVRRATSQEGRKKKVEGDARRRRGRSSRGRNDLSNNSLRAAVN